MSVASEIPDVVFDHDVAFRASWAVDEALSALDRLADHRARSSADSLCSCSGPYAESLGADVVGANRMAAGVGDELRSVGGGIGTGRDDALMAQVRVEVARSAAAEEAARSAAAASAAAAALAGSGAGLGPA